MSISYLLVLSQRHWEVQLRKQSAQTKTLATFDNDSWCRGIVDFALLNLFGRSIIARTLKSGHHIRNEKQWIEEPLEARVTFSNNEEEEEEEEESQSSLKPPWADPDLSKKSSSSIIINNNENMTSNSKEIGEDDVRNMTGSYKLVRSENWAPFLEAQGIPWIIRTVASKATPIHHIDHNGTDLRINVANVPIGGEVKYTVGGHVPVVTQIRDHVFHDTVSYADGGNGIVVKKVRVKGGERFTLKLTRKLSDDGSKLYLTSRAIYEDGREPIEAFQTFERIQ